MAAPVINASGVSKRYALGTSGTRLLSEKIGQVLRRESEPAQTFWALRDVSLTVEQGQVVGLLGPNGAGKSTLLKIFSRITTPTEGRVEMRGRIGTLLEVGTGFHPELTGRENIFLNGAILGMRRREIEQRFDEIVDFSGVEQFIDTPVKRYSSGMYVRLAFAVAAHLDSEILLVDEVLAVGDEDFQRKCLGKMQDIVRQGRTIIFVSHSMPAIRRICTRTLFVEGGQIALDGPTDEVIAAYLARHEIEVGDGEVLIDPARLRHGGDRARLTRVTLLSEDGTPIPRDAVGPTLRLKLEFELDAPVPDAVVEVGISSSDGLRAATTLSIDGGRPPLVLEAGPQTVLATIDAGLLPGNHLLDVGLYTAGGLTLDAVDGCVHFVSRPDPEHKDPFPLRGRFRPRSSFSIT
jgi:lipopolysaccharide transport system ATP-binding protein